MRGAEVVLAAAAEPDHIGPWRRRHAVLGAEVADPAPDPRGHCRQRRQLALDVDDHRIRREHGGGDRRRGAGRRGPDGDGVSPHACGPGVRPAGRGCFGRRQRQWAGQGRAEEAGGIKEGRGRVDGNGFDQGAGSAEPPAAAAAPDGVWPCGTMPMRA